VTRLPYAPDGGETADRIRERRSGALTPLDRMLLHSPPVADGWNALLGAIRERSTLPAQLRELAILRVAALNGAEYEWLAHEPAARDAGLGETALAAARDDEDPAALADAERATLAYTDAMTREVAVPQALFDELARHLDHRQLVELTATVGAYNLVSRFLVALEITPAERASEVGS
jgi:4-carboxymuconolactone decarboxylase